jgi:murein DD-endopeptidase MepM/ murein hydrolase activator NlpD
MNHLPVKTYKHALYPNGSVTQWFGVNAALYGKAVCYPDASMPTKKYCLSGHNGIDIVAPWGTPMYAVEDGIITDVSHSTTGYGKSLKIMSDAGEVVNEWVFGHCSEIFVKNGQTVTAGQLVANMGNTGFVVSGATPYWKYNPYAGTHLHLGKRVWRKVDTNYTMVLKGQPLAMVDYYNGFYGYVDFSAELGALVGLVDTMDVAAKRLTLNSLYNQLAAVIKQQRSS